MTAGGQGRPKRPQVRPEPSGDPLRLEEFGYGVGPPTGILILKYLSAGGMEIRDGRDDYLHQLYWSPEAMLSVRYGSTTGFLPSSEALWVHRGVTHEVMAPRPQTVYRIGLREVPENIDSRRISAVSVDATARELIAAIARPGQDEAAALIARQRILAGIGHRERDLHEHRAAGSVTAADMPAGVLPGSVREIAAALLRNPADGTGLAEWALRLHTTTKTLQREFGREYGMSFSQWRTRTRLQAAEVLLEEVTVAEAARLVGYASTSSFITAFGREYGYTPGRRRTDRCPAPDGQAS